MTSTPASASALERLTCLAITAPSTFKVRDYLSQLWRIARREGRAYVTPTIATICKQTSLSRSTVRRALAALCALGLLRRKPRFRTNRDGTRWRMSDFLFVTVGLAPAPAPAVAYPGKPAYEPPPRKPRKGLAIVARGLASLAARYTDPANSRLIDDAASTVSKQKEEMQPAEARLTTPEASKRSLAGFYERLASRQRRPD